MSNCGMVVVIWSPSAGVVFNSFVGSNLNLMLGDIPVRSSWLAYTHTRGITWCNYATHHLVFNFLVDWNPFLVGSSTSPVSQIPSMLLEARRITTTVVNRVYEGHQRNTFHIFPQQCDTEASRHLRPGCFTRIPAILSSSWCALMVMASLAKAKLMAASMWPLPIKMGLEHVGTRQKVALLPVVPIKIIFGRFSSRTKWLRINQQNEGTTIALSRYWLLICYWMGVKWCMQPANIWQ